MAQLHAAGLRLLAVDDYGQVDHFLADFVSNQSNTGTRQLIYSSREPYTRLLLGARHAMLRQDRNVSDTPESIASCDGAIVPGGGTIWEIALLATPALAIILATNQVEPLRRLRRCGLCRRQCSNGDGQIEADAIVGNELSDRRLLHNRQRCCRGP